MTRLKSQVFALKTISVSWVVSRKHYVYRDHFAVLQIILLSTLLAQLKLPLSKLRLSRVKYFILNSNKCLGVSLTAVLIYPKRWGFGAHQLGVPFHALTSLPPFQTPSLRKYAKIQPLSGSAQDHAYRLFKT